MRIAGVGRAFPPHYYPQSQLIDELRRLWGARHQSLSRLDALHRHVEVGGRYLALPRDEYAALATFGQSNDAYLRIAPPLADAAVRDAVRRAGVALDRVEVLVTTSVTGIAVPSLDALLMNRLGLSPHVKRVPLFGLGCAGGAAAIARAADLLRGRPTGVALVVAVELCSLTVQKDDLSLSNLIATGLFGDGAAAVVLVGDEAERAAGPRVVDTRAVFYPDSERMMGWDVSESGFRIVLSAEVPRLVRERLRDGVDQFLAAHGLRRNDIAAWISHPGGPKVLQAMQEALDLPASALARAWTSLREVGNLSSVSVLLVLGDTLESPPPPDSHGMLMAMGPGFCSELVLLRW